MSKDPAFLFYHQDFFTGVSDMTNEEIGAYIKCMCVQASKGGITEKHMLIICNSHEVHNVIKSKFVFDATIGLFENIRLKTELEKRKKYSESRSNNRKKIKTTPTTEGNICETYEKHMEDEDEIENKENNNNYLFKETLLKNKNWKNSISVKFKITDDEVVSKLTDFYNHLVTEFKVHPSMNEFTKHFKNWIPVNKEKNEKPNSKSKSNPNSGYKPASVDREKLIRELAEDAANGNIPGEYNQVRSGSQA